MSKCNTCIYRASNDVEWKCEYISIVGHSRGCEPDNKCTKYKRGKRIKLIRYPMNFKSTISMNKHL